MAFIAGIKKTGLLQARFFIIIQGLFQTTVSE